MGNNFLVNATLIKPQLAAEISAFVLALIRIFVYSACNYGEGGRGKEERGARVRAGTFARARRWQNLERAFRDALLAERSSEDSGLFLPRVNETLCELFAKRQVGHAETRVSFGASYCSFN